MKKAGRPPTPKKEQVTVIRLQKKHVDMLDEVIRQRAERDLGAVYTEPEQKVQGMNLTSWHTHVEPINYSKERRELVAMLIETGLKDDELYPTEVLLKVPRGRYRDVDLLEIGLWARKEGRLLTEKAPETVKAVLAENRLHQIRLKMPADYVDWLSAVTYAKLEEDDDDKKAP